MQPISFSWRIQIRYYSRCNVKRSAAMSQNAPLPTNSESGAGFVPCNNCHLSMPSELRFCRNCGYRLGEGSSEYTETVRFQDATYVAPVGNAANVFGGRSAQMASAAAGRISRRKMRFGGMSWIFVAVLAFFLMGGAASHFAPQFHRPGGSFGI